MPTDEEKIVGLEAEIARIRPMNAELKTAATTQAAAFAELQGKFTGVQTENAALTNKAAAFAPMGEQLAAAQAAGQRTQADFEAFKTRSVQEMTLARAGMYDPDGVAVMLTKFGQQPEGTTFDAFVTAQRETTFFKAMATTAPPGPGSNGAGVADPNGPVPKEIPTVITPAPIVPQAKPPTLDTSTGTSPGPTGGPYVAGEVARRATADPVGLLAQHGYVAQNPVRLKAAVKGG